MATDPIRYTTYYEQGPEGGSMCFMVRVTNGPVGSEVEFRAEVPNPGRPIELPLTTLEQPDEIVGVTRYVEAGYRSPIVVDYFPSGPVPADFELTFEVLFNAGPLEDAPQNREAAAAGPIVVTQPYDQGPEGGMVMFAVVVRNGTPGAVVSLSSAEPLPSGPLAIPPTKVTQNDFIVGVQAPVPANWRTVLTATYDPRGTAVRPDLSVEIRAMFVAPSQAARTGAGEPIEHRIHYSQGDVGGEMAFMMIVQNGSPGAEIAFHATTPNPGGAPIVMPRTRVTTSRWFQAGIATIVDAFYETEIIYTYYPNGTPVSPDLEIGLRVMFVAVPESMAPQPQPVAGEGDPILQLLSSLHNPMINDTAQVGVSVEATAPVLNTLVLTIQNPSDQPVIDFQNDVPPGEPLPPLDEPYVGPRLDRLYVWFPYGTTAGTLADNALAAAFTLSVAPDNVTWEVSKQSSATKGTYWILYPKLKAVLRPTESVSFIFTGVQTFNPALSSTHMRLQKQVTGYEPETDMTTQVTLVDAQPQILEFEVTPNDVVAGTTVNFSWNTWGAKSCTLGSTQGLAPAVNAYPVFVLVSGDYRLDAISATSKTAFDVRPVRVQPVRINSFIADPAQGSRIGEPVTLKWQTVSAVTMNVQPEVGEVCSNAAGCSQGEAVVYPSTRTVYVLDAQGGTSSQKAEVVVFPLPKNFLKTTSTAPWSTTAKPVIYGYSDQLVYVAGGAPQVYTSLDGATWRTVSSDTPLWGNRASAAGAVFNGGDGAKMWLLGGQEGSTVFADVFNSNKPQSNTWAKVTDNPGWAARSNHGCIVFQGKLWVLGGSNGAGGGFNDVWNSTNGKDWTKVTERAQWLPRWAFGLASFSNRLWIFGGQTGPNAGDVSDEVWSSPDGVTWTKWPKPQWTPRSYSNAQVFGDRLFLFGGQRNAIVAADDLWRMTIKVESNVEILVWSLQPTQPMGNSAGMATTMLAGGAWLAGGWSTPGTVPGPNKSVWLFAPVPL